MEQYTVSKNYYSQPDIWLAGLRIADPVIALTGLLMAVVSFYAYVKLKSRKDSEPFHKMMRWFFLFMTAASIIGAIIGHAFLYCFSIGWKFPGWVFSMLASAALAQAAVYHLQSCVNHHGPSSSSLTVFKVLTTINVVETTLAILLVYQTLNFHFVEIHSAFSLLFIVGTIESYIWLKWHSKRGAYFLLGIFWAIVAVLPHLGKFSLHVWFTYFDLGHLILCLSFLSFLKAAQSE